MKQPFNYLILRKLKEWKKNQAWLSEMTGIDKVAISKYIKGDRIPDTTLFISKNSIWKMRIDEVKEE